jgi:hypothetical protein
MVLWSLDTVRKINKNNIRLHRAGFSFYNFSYDSSISIQTNEQFVIRPTMTRAQCQQIILETLISTNSSFVFSPYQLIPEMTIPKPSAFCSSVYPSCSSIYPSPSSQLIQLDTINENDASNCGISAVLWPLSYVNDKFNLPCHVSLYLISQLFAFVRDFNLIFDLQLTMTINIMVDVFIGCCYCFCFCFC